MTQVKSLNRLARELELTSEWEYFDYIIDSFHHDKPQLAKNLYNAMKREDQIKFVSWIHSDVHTSDETITNKLLITIGE